MVSLTIYNFKKGKYMSTDYRCYEEWIMFWLPIYRKQVNECKYQEDNLALQEIYNNIDKNWNLQDYKFYIFELLGLKYLIPKENMNVEILKTYFNYKKKKEQYEIHNRHEIT